MSKSNQYDAIIIGAGIGGLSVGALLAKEGMKVLLLEQTDRVGGRALSIKGEEISDNGLQWYRDLLKTQYTYIAGSAPDMETIIRKRMLDGYTIDVGYHAISANGTGYMFDFEQLIGGVDSVVKHGGRWASYYKGGLYQDVAGHDIDPNLMQIAKDEKIPYMDFYTDPHTMTDEQIDELEKVSFKAWADQKGITKNDVIYNHLHTVSTLFSTINNPEDISIGDIFRYFKYAFGPKLASGLLQYNGGFVEGGIIKWSEAVAEKFKGFGGELKLNAKVKEVRVENGCVTGVVVAEKKGKSVEYQSSKVISNIPAQQTFRVIDQEHFPKEWADQTRSMYGYGSYTPYMGLNKLVMPEAEALLGIKNTCVLPKEEGFDHDVYICWNIQSALDPFAAPNGKYLYTAYLPLTEKESLDKLMVQKIVNRLPEFMEEIYPGFKESIDWKLDLVCWKLEGVAKSISQAGTQKVPVKSEHVTGLYFAGDTAKGYGVAMDCAIASGVICAGEIIGKDYGIR
jgi:phytoene dehydrogenase-like protein